MAISVLPSCSRPTDADRLSGIVRCPGEHNIQRGREMSIETLLVWLDDVLYDAEAELTQAQAKLEELRADEICENQRQRIPSLAMS
jgi:hypothetical protein